METVVLLTMVAVLIREEVKCINQAAKLILKENDSYLENISWQNVLKALNSNNVLEILNGKRTFGKFFTTNSKLLLGIQISCANHF